MYSSPEPEPEPEPYLNNSNNCGVAQPEPNPNWEEAKIEWGVAWEAHTYIFATAFALIAFTAVYLLTIRKEGQYRRRCFGTLQILLVITGLTRFLGLVIDPYMTNDPVVLPTAVHRVAFGLALPCLLSAFSLVFLTLIQASKVSFIHRNVMNWKVIVILCSMHFIASTVAELLIAYNIEAKLVMLLCNSYVCLWGLFLFIGFPAVGHKIIYNLVHIKRSVKMKARKEPLLKVARLAYGSAMCGALLLAVQIYFLLDMYGEALQTAGGCFSEPWLWWSFQTIARIAEILMSVILLFSTYNSLEVSRIRCLHFIPCCTNRAANLEAYRQTSSGSVIDTRQSNRDCTVLETRDLNPTVVDSDTFIEVESPVTTLAIGNGKQQEVQLLEDQVHDCPMSPTRLLKSPLPYQQSDFVYSSNVVDFVKEPMPKRPSSTSAVHMDGCSATTHV